MEIQTISDVDQDGRLKMLEAQLGALRGQVTDLLHVNIAGRAGEPAPAPAPAGLTIAKTIRQVIRQRQQRRKLFPEHLFADPAWDMLLDLAAARAEGCKVSVTSLCIASGVPMTTALRWIAALVDEKLVARVEDPADRRRMFIELTDEAAGAMARYFDSAEDSFSLCG